MGWLVSNHVVAEGCAGWAGARELEVWPYDPVFGTEGAMLDGIIDRRHWSDPAPPASWGPAAPSGRDPPPEKRPD